MKHYEFASNLEETIINRMLYEATYNSSKTKAFIGNIIEKYSHSIMEFFNIEQPCKVIQVYKCYPPSAIATASPPTIQNPGGVVELSTRSFHDMTINWDMSTYFTQLTSIKHNDLFDLAIFIFEHELWHIKQYQSGRLKLGSNECIFDECSFEVYDLGDHTLPWEVEANENALRYLNFVRDSNVEKN